MPAFPATLDPAPLRRQGPRLSTGCPSLVAPTASFRPGRGPLLASLDAWLSAANPGRALLGFLLVFVLGATLITALAYAPFDLHHDLLEFYAWGRTPAWGYDNHPPLGPWMATAWFAVFPTQDWAFTLLAALNAALGLYCVDLVARQYLSGEKRLLVQVLLLLTPAFTFHGLRLNATNLLLWTWPLATFCFLRAFRTRTLGWAVAAGAAAALAMLGKYVSGVLVAGFALAALLHPARSAYLRSPSPYVSALVGFVLLAPNIGWLLASEASPLRFAMRSHGDASNARVLFVTTRYLLAALAYTSVMLLAAWFVLRLRRSEWRDALWPSDPDRRPLAVISWTLLLLPCGLALALGLRLLSLSSLPGVFPLPILLLATAQGYAPERARLLPRAVAILACALLILAPVHAYLLQRYGTRQASNHYRLVTAEIEKLWRAHTAQRLAFVGGERQIAVAVSFYSADHPQFIQDTDDISPAGPFPERNTALVCSADKAPCVRLIDAWKAEIPTTRREEIEVRPSFLGIEGIPGRYVILVAPPPFRAYAAR